MTLANERLFVAAVAAFTLTKMFKGLLLTDYKALAYGFSCSFKCKAKLDKTFLNLFEEALSLNLRGAESAYPMTMMGDNAAALLEHQGQPLLRESFLFGKKSLVEMMKFGDTAFPAPHIKAPRLPFKLLGVQETSPGSWCLEGALFETKEALKEFIKLYTHRKSFDPFRLAQTARLVTEEGVWLEAGLTLLEEIRKGEEEFWRKRGFVRVYGPEKVLPPKSLSFVPVIDSNILNKSMLECDSPRLWARDTTGKLKLEDIIPIFSHLKAPQHITKEALLLGDPLGSFYETARMISSGPVISVSLFASPAQALAWFLQETGGNLERLRSLKKEMFEFSS